MTKNDLIPTVLEVFQQVLPQLHMQGGASGPFYQAPKGNRPAILFFREDYVRSFFHKLAHYSLVADMQRQRDAFEYWYSPCDRFSNEQEQFERFEEKPQGLKNYFVRFGRFHSQQVSMIFPEDIIRLSFLRNWKTHTLK